MWLPLSGIDWNLVHDDDDDDDDDDDVERDDDDVRRHGALHALLSGLDDT
jgi:hypothetical protein